MRTMRRSPYEILIVSLVVAIAVALAASLYAGRSRFQKGGLLASELNMMRSALITYKIINRENAPSLVKLMESDYEAEGQRIRYMERLPAAPDGALLDPFGNSYIYDPASGWVSSTTPGYERW